MINMTSFDMVNGEELRYYKITELKNEIFKREFTVVGYAGYLEDGVWKTFPRLFRQCRFSRVFDKRERPYNPDKHDNYAELEVLIPDGDWDNLTIPIVEQAMINTSMITGNIVA